MGIYRNYVAEVRALIDAQTHDGPYVSIEVAERIVADLRVRDPKLLRGFLTSQAVHIIWQMINDIDRSRRAQARERGRRHAFGQAARDHANGDTDAMTGWLDVPFPVKDGKRKRLADLTAADLRHVADEYGKRAKENLMTAAFLRALAKKVGRGTVGAVYTDPELDSLWGSLHGDPTSQA